MQEAGVFQRISDAARASRSELLLVVLLGLAIVGTGAVVVLRSSDPPAPPVERVVAQPEASASPSPVKQVVVHVSGQVNKPGVYELPDGSRVQDAVAAAGGPLAESDANALNLAAVIADGQKVTVPKPGEAVTVDPASSAEAGAPAGKVNLNLATPAQLEELPGVGPVLAERIVAHRQKGRFTSPRQLMEVSGFGPKKYEALKDQITV
ncbi:MAG TPA: helix-hairpin-helix domain-containing protein [Actinomycetota bacterium]|nr:helix-hairpin-helix domain-containing protein [Actinomycetota bacterium]